MHTGVDKRRVLALRTASDYTAQPPGLSAAEQFFQPCPGCPSDPEHSHYTGYRASLRAAFVVADVVATELVSGWSARDYATDIPGVAGGR